MASGSEFKENYYTHALVGVVKAIIAEETNADPYTLKYQLEALKRVLRDMNVGVIELDFHGPYAATLLLDRVAVSVNGVVYIPSPHSGLEEFNLSNLKVILRRDLNQTVVDQKDPYARVCGADVLIQGREIFVGISETTNEAGAAELAEVFTDLTVTAIKMPRGTTHLKDYITSGGKDMLIVGPSSEAQEIMKLLDNKAVAFFAKMHVPEAEAANCLYLNKTLIHQGAEDVPESFRMFCDQISCNRRTLGFSEYAKLHAGLSSVCLLVRKTQNNHKYYTSPAMPLGHNFW